eukprot:CAMPEP_0168524026 /NCGR_PEP_ID=MMETSP0405-20121227/10382_1 /TAXON_ID=498012 /ORGANISM="Trichosphaerium sp, Strain Am-I-7 wt" /LENGTH=211 /DNA_ID=CAMNT_0008546109 /DNA_START=81 /DNA_END=716 /DNA_ORIENTATION=-
MSQKGKKKGKNKRRRKNAGRVEQRVTDVKEAGQEYGKVLKFFGNGRLEVHCFDGKNRMCHIRGSMKKRVNRFKRINLGDIVLVQLRDYQDAKADVVMKYMPDQVRILQKRGELPKTLNVDELADAGDDKRGGNDRMGNLGFSFDAEGSDDDEEDSGPGIAPQNKPRGFDIEFSDDSDDEYEYYDTPEPAVRAKPTGAPAKQKIEDDDIDDL